MRRLLNLYLVSAVVFSAAWAINEYAIRYLHGVVYNPSTRPTSVLFVVLVCAPLGFAVAAYLFRSPVITLGGGLGTGGIFANALWRALIGPVPDYIHLNSVVTCNVADLAITACSLAVFFGICLTLFSSDSEDAEVAPVLDSSNTMPRIDA